MNGECWIMNSQGRSPEPEIRSQEARLGSLDKSEVQGRGLGMEDSGLKIVESKAEGFSTDKGLWTTNIMRDLKDCFFTERSHHLLKIKEIVKNEARTKP